MSNIYFAGFLSLAMMATPIYAQDETLSFAPPAEDKVTIEDCTVSRSEIRAKFPQLTAFVQETYIDDFSLIYGDVRSALKQFLKSDKAKDGKSDQKLIKSEMKAFHATYPKKSSCRAAAWVALGANSYAPTLIDEAETGIEAA